MDSIINNDKTHCYTCGKFGATEEHHCIMGTAQRKKSEKYGLKVNVCRTCHSRIHEKNWKRRELESLAQTYFEQTFFDEDFLKIFGRNYK